MKKLLFLLPTLCIFVASCSAQFNLKKIGKGVKETTEKVLGDDKKLSNDEIIAGLKEALSIGTNNSTESASKVDGFYKNPMIFIPFPEEAQTVKKKVEAIGMKKQVDEFVMTLNRAAEEAAKEAAPIFLDAIKQMSISDGLSILKGEDNAATMFLKDKTSVALHGKFKPIVEKATSKVQVTKHWTPIITAYNNIPFVKKIDPDLNEYVTQKALEGLFLLVEKEEEKIRKDPLARVTDLLKKVFG